MSGSVVLGVAVVDGAMVVVLPVSSDVSPSLDSVPSLDSPDSLDEPADGPVWATESGFWRVPPERPDDLPADKHPVEALLSDPSGHLSLYVGAIGSGRIDLVSDLIARTPTAAEVTAASRLYGYVEGDLMWAWDLAAFGEPLQSYASARLSRVEGPAA